jgi:hypothetical protein
MEHVCLNPKNLYKIHFRSISIVDIFILSGEMGMRIKFHSESLQRRHHLEDLNVDGSAVLK